MPKRIIITVKYDVTDQFEEEILNKDGSLAMSNQDIKEFFSDSPELIHDCDFVTDKSGNIVWDVERET